jgi:hypothetical protein
MSQPLQAKPQAAGLRAEFERLCDEYADGSRPREPESGSLVFVATDVYTGGVEAPREVSDAERDHANALLELAKRAAEAGQLSLAFQWATEAVHANPDHEEARRVLGYERRGDQWLTSYAARMVDAGKTWDSERGWIAPDETSDERPSAKGEWRVRTDHFLVTSNHSQTAAAELAAQLERLHQVWRQLFAGFYLSDREVRELFAGERQARTRHRPFRVIHHRDKDDYVAALRRRQPRIAETLGIYFDTQREAHFFAGDDADAGTLYHEAVHQLFQETRPAARKVAQDANFWIIEGIATYFETLAEHRDPRMGLYYTIGEASAGRLPSARRRALVDGFYVPLAELTTLGKEPLQRYPELAKLYGQSTGLAAFLMDGQQGRYREPLVSYLAAVYAGRDDAETLSTLTSTSVSDLDAEYREFLQSLP